MKNSFAAYTRSLSTILENADTSTIERLSNALLTVWQEDRQFFLCGNGGSAGNAAHLANDMIYGIDRKTGKGLRAHALTANVSIVTCLANDEGYDEIFSKQLAVYARPGDVLLVLSGSGNSPNILRALDFANANEVETFAIVGYDGGKAKSLAKHSIHFDIDDMQISEDTQLVVMHYIMQQLASHCATISE